MIPNQCEAEAAEAFANAGRELAGIVSEAEDVECFKMHGGPIGGLGLWPGHKLIPERVHGECQILLADEIGTRRVQLG